MADLVYSLELAGLAQLQDPVQPVLVAGNVLIAKFGKYLNNAYVVKMVLLAPSSVLKKIVRIFFISFSINILITNVVLCLQQE